MEIRIIPMIRKKIFERDGYQCTYCKERFHINELEADHIFPKSRGGKDEFTNLTTTCRRCNRKKTDDILENPPAVQDIILTKEEQEKYESEIQYLNAGVSRFNKTIRISKENIDLLYSIKGKKSLAGKVEEIINWYFDTQVSPEEKQRIEDEIKKLET